MKVLKKSTLFCTFRNRIESKKKTKNVSPPKVRYAKIVRALEVRFVFEDVVFRRFVSCLFSFRFRGRPSSRRTKKPLRSTER